MLETERLIIRKLTMDDLPWLIETRSDPDMYRYLGGLEKQNPDAVTKRMGFYLECYEKFGFGQSAMVWKETGDRIGCSGLQPLENTGEIEVDRFQQSKRSAEAQLAAQRARVAQMNAAQFRISLGMEDMEG